MKKSKSNCEGRRVIDDSGVEKTDAVARRCCFVAVGVKGASAADAAAAAAADKGAGFPLKIGEAVPIVGLTSSATPPPPPPPTSLSLASASAAAISPPSESLLLPVEDEAEESSTCGRAESMPRSSCCETASNHCSNAIMHALTALMLCTEVAE